MRILVVGAGAVGGYYGGRLAQAGRDVTFLLRDRRAAQIRERGLNLISPRGDVTLHPAIVSAEQLRSAAQPYDLILLSTKSYALDAAMDDFAPAVGSNTLVLPLLNGMQHLDTLDARFGREHVLGGTVRIMAEVLPNGDVWQHNPLDQLTFGFRPATVDNAARAAQILEQLTVHGFSTTNSPDVVADMWQKWWLLAAIGTACVLSDASLGEARRTVGGEEFNRAVLDECMAVATANGHAPRAELIEEMRTRFADPDSTVTSSMYRDMKAGGEVEADQILGDLIRRANGVPTPLLRAAFVRLQIYQSRRIATA
ncbi:ketopantoate reductase family protein [Terriglobus aquaticus]|uniref:2-dehydropantoate 2-reductase n=1 Tax=Terriglobus aquaticus TaxID=940139 RepID=A0ABW9KPH7_9BACT|nr:ketopantoate reductase family protein [Terriglobus aquaticus]